MQIYTDLTHAESKKKLKKIRKAISKVEKEMKTVMKFIDIGEQIYCELSEEDQLIFQEKFEEEYLQKEQTKKNVMMVMEELPHIKQQLSEKEGMFKWKNVNSAAIYPSRPTLLRLGDGSVSDNHYI